MGLWAENMQSLKRCKIGQRLLWRTNIVVTYALSTGTKINDLGWPWTAETTLAECRKKRFTQPTRNKKLSYRRETARHLHTSFSAHSLIVHFTEHLFYASVLQLYNRLAKLVSAISADKPCDMRTFKLNRAFKVIQGHPYWCRQESRMVCCRNVQLIPTLFLKLTKIRQR